MRFKKDDEGKLVLDDGGDPIAIDSAGEVIPLDKVVSLGKHQRIEGERDEYKTRVETLEAQISELQKVSGDKDELEKKLTEMAADAEKTRTDLESRMAAKDKEYAVEAALLKAGCRDTTAARAHVDMDAIKIEDASLKGLDIEAFKKDRPYLFGPSDTVDTAPPLRGAGGISNADLEAMSVDEYAAARKDGKI